MRQLLPPRGSWGAALVVACALGACDDGKAAGGDGPRAPEADGGTSADGPAGGGDARPGPDGGARDAASPADAPVDPPFQGQVGSILFVTQVPHDGFSTVSSTFGNHEASLASVPRGGDLMIRYPDGTLRNLTREAGFGNAGMQGAGSIAVRQPCVHWSGNRALFSMVVGAPTAQYMVAQYRWQIYEVTGLAQGEAVAIRAVPGQPADFNNVSPFYGTDDRVLFTSDRPRDGSAHLYPQLDEYESAATVTGVWSLEPQSGELVLLEHSPSGAFSPKIDSFGRIVFTKWDHLQRDQQVDYTMADQMGAYGAFTYSDESAGAMRLAEVRGMESFPEPRDRADPDAKPTVSLHTFNQFVPWEMREDGSGEETLNHVGRHELGGSYSDGSFTDDPNLTYNTPESAHRNRFYLRGDGGLFHLQEDPRSPGTFYATYAREFGSASAGAILRLNGAPTDNPEDMVIVPVTHPDSYSQPEDPSMAGGSTGHYKSPLPMSDGTLVAVHTSVVGPSKNLGSRAAPRWNYDFRLRAMEQQGGMYRAAGAPLTAGLMADVTAWDPDQLVSYQGLLWELDPVEVRPRTRPARRVQAIEPPEQAVFAGEGVDADRLRAWLRDRGLALIISRNVTYRDRADVQQPFNLRVPGGVQTLGAMGKVYDVAHFQIFQADALRGYGGTAMPRAGRRLLARPMHEADVSVAAAGAPAGSVEVAADGSMAAFVPARRALTWQLSSPAGEPVVRERNWVSFQAGEIRTCAVCHGLNTKSQSGDGVPQTEPEALRQLLRRWRAANP